MTNTPDPIIAEHAIADHAPSTDPTAQVPATPRPRGRPPKPKPPPSKKPFTPKAKIKPGPKSPYRKAVETKRTQILNDGYPTRTMALLVSRFLTHFNFIKAYTEAGFVPNDTMSPSKVMGQDSFQQELRRQLSVLKMSTYANVARDGKGTASTNAIDALIPLVIAAVKAETTDPNKSEDLAIREGWGNLGQSSYKSNS